MSGNFQIFVGNPEQEHDGVRSKQNSKLLEKVKTAKQVLIMTDHSSQSKKTHHEGPLTMDVIKASFSFPKIIPKNTQMYTLSTNLSFYITFTLFHYI